MCAANRVMMSTSGIICTLTEVLAAHTSRAISTVSRLSTGSGDTYRRLKLRGPNGSRRHRISTERVEASLAWFDANWPEDLAWPTDIPRPSNKEDAA
ncbi:hypothetical protein SAMN05444414_11629 [Roseovarius marisflavi]|uniref:Uncharacterized protein n=1 Tax=Roseovarius marisflavi TaxID=1054996 RepID=A0A1M7B2T0_9RHOB|nr:hypothetical protein SAMN05444414_11629 [Roseovarius marisflavi]